MVIYLLFSYYTWFKPIGVVFNSFLLLNLYLLISDPQYFLKWPKEICTEYEIIQDEGTCESAAKELKLVYQNSETKSKFPKGCYKVDTNDDAYWNDHIQGTPNEKASPICKESEFLFIKYFKF